MTKPELKICLVGSAPSSVRIAPYADPAWQIWGCSPGVYGVAPRVDVWFELHRYEPGQPWFSPEYCQWLASRKHPVMMAEKRAEIPTSETMPVDALVAKYGPYFFTSSLAWMFACALEAGATKIMLAGVDMAANDEYGDQRSGLHYFGMLAASMGVEVGVPPESDLFRPRPLYGVDELKHSSIKMLARQRELKARLQQVQQTEELAKQERCFLQGALDDTNYQTLTWADPREFCAPPAVKAMEALAAPAFVVTSGAVDPEPLAPEWAEHCRLNPIADSRPICVPQRPSVLNSCPPVGDREMR